MTLRKMERMNVPFEDNVWATKYADGWSVFTLDRGMIAHGLTKAAASKLISEEDENWHA